MNLYKLTSKRAFAYDTFDSCIVASESEDKAKFIRPDSETDWSDEKRMMYGCWAKRVDDVEVEYVGTAAPDIKEGEVILSSYNAG